MADEYSGSHENGNHHKHIRDKIRASMLLRRLEQNAAGELEKPMSSGEIKSAEIVLKKVIPDLSAITLQGDSEKPVVTEVRHTIVDHSRHPSSPDLPSTPVSGEIQGS